MPAGRPPKYETAQEIQRIVDLYFLACKVHQTGDETLLNDLSEEDLQLVNGIDCSYPTITGMALALGMTRKGLIDYENKDDPSFGNTIKKAKARVEAFVEQRLYHPNATGSIFNLKNNFGWVDRVEKEISGNLGLGGILEEIDGRSSGLPSDQE